MQATVQDPHPVHLSKSMYIPNLWTVSFFIYTSSPVYSERLSPVTLGAAAFGSYS
jgi:hypothetical protein